MTVICAVDDDMGLSFNGRRQSRDRAVTERICELCREMPVHTTASGARLLPEGTEVYLSEDPLRDTPEGEGCFIETMDPAEAADRVERVILFRWNRHYPADVRFTLPLEDMTLLSRVEYPGSSHERLTEEVWVR